MSPEFFLDFQRATAWHRRLYYSRLGRRCQATEGCKKIRYPPKAPGGEHFPCKYYIPSERICKYPHVPKFSLIKANGLFILTKSYTFNRISVTDREIYISELYVSATFPISKKTIKENEKTPCGMTVCARRSQEQNTRQRSFLFLFSHSILFSSYIFFLLLLLLFFFLTPFLTCQ